MSAPDLTAYDVILINTSAGKDSQAMMDRLVAQADALGIRARLVAVHADLGRVEWAGTRDLAQAQAEHYGLRFEVVSRPQGDLLAQVEARGMWPSSTARYCTSDHKRGQISKVVTMLTNEVRERRPGHRVQVLNCLGFRAEESPARAKRVAFSRDDRLTNGKRVVDVWLPIHDWSEAQVWARIKASGVPHHPAYDLGMPRLSCVFCVFASRSALTIAGKANPALLAAYVALEDKMGHTFRKDFAIESVRDDIAAGVTPASGENWSA